MTISSYYRTIDRPSNNDDVLVFRDQDAVDRLRGHDSLVVGHRQVSQYAESRPQSVIFLLFGDFNAPFRYPRQILSVAHLFRPRADTHPSLTRTLSLSYVLSSDAAAVSPLFPFFSPCLPVFSSFSPCAASFSRPKVLLKCITLNWKENSVKVQSVVHEREKRKAKEGATFFLFRQISNRRGKLLYLFFFSLPNNCTAQISCELCRRSMALDVREGRKHIVRIKLRIRVLYNKRQSG